MDRETRRKKLVRVMLATFAVIAVGAAASGVGLGLAEQNASWGFAGAGIFCAGAFVLDLIVLAVRGHLRTTGRLYRQAARNMNRPVTLRKRHPDSN